MRVDGSQILNPGNLIHRVTWTKKVVTGQNELGEDVITMEPIVTTPARVSALEGKELDAARQRWAEARFKVAFHYVAGIEREMIGEWGNRRLDVLDAEDPYGTGRWMVVLARELVR